MSVDQHLNHRPEKSHLVQVDGGSLDTQTNLGYVHLNITRLQRSVDFYERAIGLKSLKQDGNSVHLGVGDDILVELTEIPGAIRYPRHSGLYHFAILTPSREALGRSLRNLIDTGTEIQGGADHLVSEALYLADPDGNGIEIYRDRPRSTWQYEDGHVNMATDPLDYHSILEDADGDWHGLEPGTRLGHMHLHVADLEPAIQFYEHLLGFDFLMNYMGSAAFLSVGGYHHHIGINTWNGVGASPNPPDAVGLRYFSVNLVSDDQRRALRVRLEKANWPFEEINTGIMVRDPSQNAILLQWVKD
jgi:catechol 2,3-dioxygenase